MQLLNLPPEILLSIIRLLGPEYFRHDSRRFLVSKAWYDLANVVLLRNVQFSAVSLNRFLKATRPALLCKYTKTLTIALDWYLDCEPGAPAPHLLRYKDGLSWSKDLHTNLIKLGPILRHCASLHHLKLQVQPGPDNVCIPWSEYLTSQSVARLLPTGHLTRLDLDMAGLRIRDEFDYYTFHICDVVRELLPTLRVLRCRMRKICPQVLIPPEGEPSRLEEVIVNLDLSHIPVRQLTEAFLWDKAPRYPARCGLFPPGKFPQWKADLEAEAERLVGRMAKPRVVRVLSHISDTELESFDAIRRRRMRLAHDAAWDADGEEM